MPSLSSSHATDVTTKMNGVKNTVMVPYNITCARMDPGIRQTLSLAHKHANSGQKMHAMTIPATSIHWSGDKCIVRWSSSSAKRKHAASGTPEMPGYPYSIGMVFRLQPALAVFWPR